MHVLSLAEINRVVFFSYLTCEKVIESGKIDNSSIELIVIYMAMTKMINNSTLIMRYSAIVTFCKTHYDELLFAIYIGRKSYHSRINGRKFL